MAVVDRSPDRCRGPLWGVMLVATQRAEPFPAGAEERLAAFTELVATAVGNAQASDELRRFGDEQAALRRVATLVARRVSRPRSSSLRSRDEVGRRAGRHEGDDRPVRG